MTLRRAAKIRNRLTERLAELSSMLVNTHSTVNIYDLNISTKLSTDADVYAETLARFYAVSQTLFAIRSRIEDSNTSNGVNRLLTERVALLGQLRLIKRIASTTEVRLDNALIKARVDGAIERAKVAQYSNDTIAFNFITTSMVESAKQQTVEIQARLDIIQDELENINSNQKISMTDAEMSVLTQERII